MGEKKMKIPWSQPDINEEDGKAMQKIIESGWLSEGKVTEEFEREIEKYIGCKHAIIFNSATAALLTTLFAHNIHHKSVAVPAYGFIAVTNVAMAKEITPILIDSSKETLDMTIETLRTGTARNPVRVVMPIDVAGMPIDIYSFKEYCNKNDILLIEDAAEAFGSEYMHRKIGSFGHITIFSFHIAKTITTVEGGCICTDDYEIAEKCRMIKNHGVKAEKTRTRFDYFGFNFRTTDIQSALGLSQLKRVDEFLKHRNKLAESYLEEFEGLADFQHVPSYVTRHSWMFFPIFVDERRRDDINRFLNDNGIGTRICWIPVHQQKFHEQFFHGQSYPIAEELGRRNITLTIGNGITEEQVTYVVEKLKEALKK